MAGIAEWFFIILYGSVLGILCFFGLHRLYMVVLYYLYSKNVPKPPEDPDYRPMVTVQLPMYNEKTVAERVIRAVANMRYPREKLEIQVLDDSTDETVHIAQKVVEELREKGIDIHYIHRSDRSGYKAGALNHGLKTAKGEVIAIFDADFIPPVDFLEKTAPYFKDPKIGVVQARWEHINENFSLLTKVQAMLLNGHFFLESGARSRSGRFFNFNGTAGLWRRRAIDDSGGWAYDTLTEDLELSYRAQMRGWKFIFLQDIAVPSELPIEMNAFKAQQFRWSKGAIQTGRKILPKLFKSNMPWHIKLEGFFHMYGHVSYILLLLLCLLMPFSAWIYRDDPLRYFHLSVYHIFLLGTISVGLFYSLSGVEAGRGLGSQLLMLFPLMALGAGMTVNNSIAVLEGLSGKPSEFVRTPKYSADGTSVKREYSAKRTRSSWAELAMGLHLTTGTYIAFQYELYPALPFMILFQVGFLYVALHSFMEEHFALKSTAVTEEFAKQTA